MTAELLYYGLEGRSFQTMSKTVIHFKNQLKHQLTTFNNENKDLFKLWLDNIDSYEITKNVYENLNYYLYYLDITY